MRHAVATEGGGPSAGPLPSRPAAGCETQPALRPSMPARAGMEPRASFPLGAEPGHQQSGGLLVPGEEQGGNALRGLQGRPAYPSAEGRT
jgi:hypothetical protein